MTDNEKNLFVAILSLTDKLNNNNNDIASEISTINSNATEDYLKNQVIDMINGQIDTVNYFKADLLKTAISQLSIFSGLGLEKVVDMQCVDIGNPQAIRTAVENSINETLSDYRYWRLVTFFAIRLGDRDLIKQSIDKISTL